MKNFGRNDPCPCGSGKKFKKCCEPIIKAQLTLGAHERRMSGISRYAGPLPGSPEYDKFTQFIKENSPDKKAKIEIAKMFSITVTKVKSFFMMVQDSLAKITIFYKKAEIAFEYRTLVFLHRVRLLACLCSIPIYIT